MNTFFLIFIGLPALEIFLMIKIGGKIGALSTISLILLTAIVGVYFAKLQGLQTLKSGMINLYQNKAPVYELMAGASIAFAAILLIVPGFFTDFVGFLLLIPFTRNTFFKFLLKDKKFEETKLKNKVIDGEVVNKDKDKDEL